MKREEAIAIYQAGEEPVVEKLCELSTKIDEQAKKKKGNGEKSQVTTS